MTAGPKKTFSLDRDAMLVALVLDPSTYSRNRFFALYDDPEVRRARRRAALIRSLVRQLATLDETIRGPALERAQAMAESDAGAQEKPSIVLAYEVPDVGLKRSTRLTRTELSVLRFALSRALPEPEDDAADRERIESALSRLVG